MEQASLSNIGRDQIMSKTLECVDCGASFEFTDGMKANLERLVEEGKIEQWTEPKRCMDCRNAKKQRSGNPHGRPMQSGQREMTSVTCSECGKPAQVPFKPRGDRPVYCSDCFSKQKK